MLGALVRHHRAAAAAAGARGLQQGASSGSAPRRSRSSPARRRSSRRTRASGSRPSRRCRAISTSPSSPSTRCSSAPISSAAMSSPTACSTGAAARRRWCSAPRPCGRWSSGCCRAPHVLTRPRLSQLTFAGEKKITRLPRRSAIVAFSAEEVYAIAELIRRQRGGAAVVLGALSPRTRNAQVALYQSGDVDYLVATDAIGMGLNLDVDHVAFASDRKFDGYQFRKLNPAELAQIAGRAGRATRDGTFGTTGRCPPFETELVQALESHSFEPVQVLQWRNTDARFRLARRAAGVARRDADGERAHARADRRGHPGAGARRARRRRPRAGDDAGGGRAAVGGLPGSRLPQDRAGHPCRAGRPRSIGFLMREGAIPTDWFARQVDAGRPHRRRHRHAVEPHRAYPDLDLRRQPAGLARRSRALAGRHPRASRTSCPMRCTSG